MASGKSSSGAAGRLLMIGAFVFVGGFLYWLTARSNEYVLSITVEDTEEVEDTRNLGSAVVIPVDVFGSDPMAQEDILIQINELTITSLLDSEAFFIEVAGQPYLIKMSSALVSDSISVTMGENVSIIGNVHQMTDSIADSWVAMGALTEANKIVATFSETFVEAIEVTVYSAPGADN